MAISLLQKARALTLLLCISCSTQAALNLAAPLPIGPQVKVGKLPNGLSYYIQQNSRPEKRVELRLVLKVGSLMEDDDQQGLAHFTEHMAFNGSRHFKKHELISYLQSIGVKFGADLNAYTSFDETVYILPIPTDKKENLETGFQVLEDWAQGVQMNGADIDKERDIILEEARLGKGAGDRMNKVLWPELFQGSKYAERLPIGKEEILKNFSHEALRRFYADWYRPDLMAVVVVGDVEPAQAEQMIQTHFAHLQNPAQERRRDYAKLPTRKDSKGLVITDPEATSNVLFIRYPIQAKTPNASIGDYRQGIVKSLYSAILGQRLQDLAQQAAPPFLGAGSSLGMLATGYESYTSVAVPAAGGVGAALTALVQENERARQFGFSAAELERSKKNRLRNMEKAYSERDKSNSANYAAEYLRHFLQQESIPGIANEYAYVSELLPGITLEEINQYARRATPSATRKLVVYMGSSKSEQAPPSGPQLLELVETAEQAPLTVRKEDQIATSLMEQPPKAGHIIAETQNQQLGTTELTLSNGLRVILKPTDFKNDEVLLSATRFGGQSLFGQADLYNAHYVNGVVWSMGLDRFTPSEIPKILAGKSAHLQTSSDTYTESIWGSAGSADLEALLQLLYLRLAPPRRDEALFKAYISKSRDATKNGMASPQAIFADALQATLYQQHPRLIHNARPEDFSQIDLERSMAIFSERFSSAHGLTFVLVGSFEPEKIKPLIASYLASLPTGELATHYRDLGIRPVTGVVKQEVRSGSEQKSQVALIFTGPAAYSRAENTRFHALLEVLNLRITDELREKLTLIYGGGMHGGLERVPYGHYQIAASLPCGPENVEKVIAATLAEIQKIKDNGPQSSDLDKVKQNWQKEHQIAMRTNAYWRDYLHSASLYGDDPADILSVEQRLAAITPAELQDAARRYFNLENYLQTVLYPKDRPLTAAVAAQR